MKLRVACQRASLITPMPWVAASPPVTRRYCLRVDNPNMSDELLAWGLSTLKQYRLVTGGDAATQGIGVMSDARWQATRNFMVEAGLLGADAPWQKAYTTRFVQDLKVLPTAEQAASR